MEQKKRLSSGKWLILFLVTALLLALLVPAFNLITDPYGAFGDPVLKWWTYDMTMNPRLAKVRYLQENHEKYDSYIIGASGSSVLPVDKLNAYLDASFYNTFFFLSSSVGFRDITRYLVDRYPVKNLILNLSIYAAANNPNNGEPLSKYHYWEVDGSSPLEFYSTYLFLTPLEGIQKLDYLAHDSYLQAEYKNVIPETGAYDKSRRDAEPIHDLRTYLANPRYKVFSNYSTHHYGVPFLDETIDAVREIKACCDTHGVNLIVTCQPMYYMNMKYFDRKTVQETFYNALAEVTDYWDFTMSSISYDPRYFYDGTHARNPVGEMMLARIFGDDSVYVPEDFGRYVTQGSKPGAPRAEELPRSTYSAVLPILRLPHPKQDARGGDWISPAGLADQLDAITAAGFHPVSIGAVRDYVENGGALPEKPVLLTFDGVYETDYALTLPLLKERGIPAAFFVSGSALEQAASAEEAPVSADHRKEMTDSGLVTLSSMGYDLLGPAGQENPAGALMPESGVTEAEYVDNLTADTERMRELLGESAGFFAYPYDQKDERSLVILTQAGTFATVCAGGTEATLIRGLPQSMLDMSRWDVSADMTGEDVVALLQHRYGKDS